MVSRATSLGSVKYFYYCFPAKQFWISLSTSVGTLSQSNWKNWFLPWDRWVLTGLEDLPALPDPTNPNCQHTNWTMEGIQKLTRVWEEQLVVQMNENRTWDHTPAGGNWGPQEKFSVKQAPGSDFFVVKGLHLPIPSRMSTALEN